LGIAVAEHPIQVDGEIVHVSISGAWSERGDGEGRPSPARAVAALTRVPFRAEAAAAGDGWARRYREDMSVAAGVLLALSRGRLTLAVQPVTRIGDPKMTLYSEALLRRSGANGQWMSPGGFLPSLERLGLVRLLDREIVARVLAMLKVDPAINLSVNISGQSAQLDGWWLQAVESLRRRRDIASRLVIEISEIWPMPSIAEAATFAARMRDLGCRVALDNFGAGHASVGQLLALRPDIVKVAPLFLSRAETSPAGEDALRHIIGLAKAMAPTVVLGGVETPSLARIAAASGAAWHQGRLLGAPEVVPGAAFRSPILGDRARAKARPGVG
jgi:EAL domain-containing protein (putative c-di-GMP-specific phosphodiesterase class I)